MYFDHGVLTFQSTLASRDEVLTELARGLTEAGVVRDTFTQAVLDREVAYPTGLDLGSVGVAIPHTDAEHVITPQLGFMSLAQPVDFIEMGTDDQVVAVSMVIMMALPKAADQIPMLQKLVAMFEDSDKIQRLKVATTADEVTAVFDEAGIN